MYFKYCVFSNINELILNSGSRGIVYKNTIFNEHPVIYGNILQSMQKPNINSNKSEKKSMRKSFVIEMLLYPKASFICPNNDTNN